VLLSASLVRNERQEPICVMCSFVDITDRKRIEEELRVKESAIESSIDGIGLSDLEGNIIYVNNAALRMWGDEDASDVIGTSALNLAQSEEEALSIYQSVIEKGSWSGEVSGFRKDGSPITVLLSASLVRNEKGEPICMMDSFVDITGRKKMEEELRIKENAIASSIDGIGISDLEGRITYVNDAALKMWGANDLSEVLGKSVLEFAQSEEEALKILTAFLEKGSWSGEVSGFRKDGSPITVLLSASLVRDSRGEPICMMDSFVDITERKKMEEELRIKESAIASSIDGIGISDLEGRITYVNDAALKMWGADDASEMLGKSVLEFAQSEEEAIEILTAFLEKGSWSGEVSGFRKDGSPITVHLSASLVRNEKGEPICMMDSFVDITERKKMEEEMRIKDCAISSSINGIAIADLEGNLTYVNDAFMRLWGGRDTSEVLGKSALTFAQSQEEAARILAEVLTKGTWFGEIIALKKNRSPIAVQLSGNVVKDGGGSPICLLCSFVDITERKIAEQKLQKAYESLEQRVEERTEEILRANIRLKREVEERKLAEQALIQKEEELRLKSLNLEEANTALKVLLKRGEQDKKELEDKVLSNIKELALPYLEKLKGGMLDEKQMTYLKLLESNLNDIISPFLQKLSSQYLNLTPTEIQVANLVREGKSTKEISSLLNISKRAVEFHRNNIRDKLGLKKAKANLRSYLLSLS
ncbi:MAG TPA: PAS domain S-box protein, partial [Deltaproteobacteria bacterium]|nr:PAS domain S-box protein [Deltaproteobacteria bacterium]